MRRRRFLTAAAAAGAAGLAGCSSASGAVAPPQIPDEQLSEGNWERVDARQEQVFERSYGPVTVTADAHTVVYEDVGLASEISSKTLEEVSGRFSLFSATRVDLNPSLDDLPGGVGREQILDRTEENARQQFRSEMDAAGLASVEQASTGTITVDTGEEASLTSYTASFPVADISFPVTDDEAITIEGGGIDVAGDLAVWHHDGSVLVAGGAYPGQNFTRRVERSLSDAIDVTVDVDLGLTPEQYREEVRALIKAVN